MKKRKMKKRNLSPQRRGFLSRVMKRANALLWQKGWEQSKAMKHAFAAENLREALKAGPVRFSFLKATGEERKAFGTLNRKLFKPTPSKGTRKSSPMVVVYHDLEKDAPRSFNIERLIREA